MRKVKTADLREGMKFTKTVFIDQNNILVAPRVAIKKKDIERLLAWGIYELETAGDVLEINSEELQAGLTDVEKKEAELQKLVNEQNRKAYSKINDESRFNLDLVDNYESETEKVYLDWVDKVGEIYKKTKENKGLDKTLARKIVNEIIEDVRNYKTEIIYVMRSIDAKENYLYMHGVNVAILGTVVGMSLNFNAERLKKLVLGCLLIDIGMIRVPDSIINKKGKLSEEELKKIHTHPVYGYQILVQESGLPLDVGRVSLEHQEQCDGNGYPRRLKESQISIFGKIAAVVDTYDAMTKKRSYRSELISYEAMKNILSTGQQKFDQTILNIFLKEMGVYPVGTYVKLNNNCIGVVTEANTKLPMRPKIKILKDEFGDIVTEEDIINLSEEKDLFIVKALKENDAEKESFE